MRFILPGRRAATLGLPVLSCFLALLVAEGAFRLEGHRLAANGEWFAAGRIIRTDDPPVGFSLEPGSSQAAVRGGGYTFVARISSAGLHDVEHAPRRTAGTRRILILGDSFMFAPGVPIEQNMARRLEGLMDGVEVLNAGVPGYSLGQEYLYYKDRGFRFGADLVLLAFFINDLAEPPRFQVEDGPDGLPRAYRRIGGPVAAERGGVVSWLTARSLLAAFVAERLGWAVDAAPPPPKEPRAKEPRPAEPRLPPEVPAFRVPPDGAGPDGASPGWARAWRVLDALKGEAAAHDARLAVIMIPAPFQISSAKWDAWVKYLGEPPESVSRRGPQQMVMTWCGRTATPCLDLLERFENGPVERLYIPHDLHWTAEGHRVAAEAVSAFLKSQRLP